MSLADDIINGTYKQKGISANTSKKETQTAPVKNVNEEIISGTYTKRNINTNLTSKSRARLNTIKKKQETKQITPVKKVVNRLSNMGQSASTGIKRGLLNKVTNVTNKAKYVNSSFGSGVTSGVTGLAQAPITDAASEASKGKEKDWVELADNSIRVIGSLINPMGYVNNAIKAPIKIDKQILDTLKDKDKNTWEKISDIALNNISESKGTLPVQQMYSSTMQNIGKAMPNTSEELLKLNEKVGEPAKKLREQIAKESENYDGLTNFIAGGAQSIGNMVPSIVTSAITKNPNASLATMGLSIKGQATQEALDKGMDIEKATQIGDAKALIEVATEKISGGTKIFGKGNLDDLADDLVKYGAKSKFGKFLMKQLTNTGGEILEEEISNVLGNTIDKGTVDSERKIINWQEALETAGSTAFTTTMLNLLTGGMVNDYRETSNNMGQYRDANTRRYLDNNTQDIMKQAENIINQNQPTAPINTLNQHNQMQNEPIAPNQQITLQENQTAQNGNMEQKNNILSVPKEKLSKFKSIYKNAFYEDGSFKPFKDQLRDFFDKKTYKGEKLIVKPNNSNLEYANIRNTPMEITEHAINSHQDNVSREIIENLPEELDNSVMALDSTSRPELNARVVVLDEYDDNGNPIIATIHQINGKVQIEINKLASIYEKEDFQSFINDTVKKGGKIYKNNKTDDWLSFSRLQLPEEVSNNSSVFINNIIPPINQKVNGNTINNNYAQNVQNDTQNQPIPPINNTQGETVNWNEIERPEGKVRKHYKSIIESSNTTAEAKAIARELIGSDTYVPESNKQHLNEADRRIQTNGADNELNALTSMSNRIDAKITANDIAVGERLIEYYSKIGDKAKLQEAIQTTAMAGTQAGRTVQALSLLNHQTPQGQVTWIQRSVDKMNQELVKKRGQNAQQFNFTPEMQQKILETTNQEEMNQVLDEVYEELGQQVSKSRLEQIDSWRYFSMLANPKTHIRNIVGNVAMGKLQTVKNKVAGTIEGTVAQFNPNMERTHTLKPASKEVKSFARNDITNVADRLELNDNKYNPKSRLENSMRTFKSDVMENTLGKTFELNEKALEVEDAWGLKSGYVKALSEYMTANNLNPQTITDTQLAKARNYAIAEAKEATFHSENAIATAINQFSRKNKVTKGITDAVLPFVKTPMNVAKGGMEYNPAGLIKTLTYDTVQLRKGNISVNKYIDNLSKGLTGTGVAILGYAMAEAGILKASGGDDEKKEKFDEALGKQSYSLEINGKTYSLDWLAPAGIPLFVGAEAHNINKAGDNEKTSKSTDDDKQSKQIIESMENWANAMTNSMSPMAEMSMISGLTSALKSYDQDSQKMLGTIGTNAVKSYVNQFVPTALGQVAKTTDDYERSTTSTAKGILPKAIDQTKLQMMSKIPGLRQTLPIKTDVWGKEQKQEGNVVEKAVKNAILPFNIKSVSNSKVDKALNELYGKTGSVSILPTTSLDKTFKIDGQTYRMTNEEYNKYRKDYGQNSYKLLNDLVSSNAYKSLNDEQKQKAIESIYKYAKEKNKINYAKNNKVKVEPSTLYKTMEDIKTKGGNQSSYLHYLSKTENMTKQNDKIKVLTEAKYSDKEKTSIYENCLKSKDKEDTISTYEIMKKAGLNINEWLKYSQQEFESDKEDDGTLKGKSVDGSKKQKVYSYINSANMNYNQRLLLLGTQYKLNNSERRTLVNYVNNMKADYSTRMKIFSKIKGVTVYKNGTIKY